MKKFYFISFLALSLTLAACSEESEQPESKTASNSAEEVSTETQEQEEGTTEETESEVGAEEDNETASKTDEGESVTDEETEDEAGSETNTEESEPFNSELLFDIKSPEVQSQLLGTSAGNDEGTFEQDLITEGMTQTEVEGLYGPYEFTFYTGGASPAFHGNLGVVYSERVPYGPGDDGSDSTINPDENYVEYVWYVAHITGEELTNALGEPDDYNDGSQSMNGLPFYVYEGEGEDGRYFITGVSTYNSPEGERIGLIKREIFDENPQGSFGPEEERYFDEYYTEGFPVELTEEDDYFTYDTLRNFIFRTYLDNLAAYYNGGNNDVLSILEGTALDKIQANKASGDFSNHRNYPGTTVSAEQISEREYQITVNRTYSHATSNGQQTSQVTYTVRDTDGTLKITDYQ